MQQSAIRPPFCLLALTFALAVLAGCSTSLERIRPLVLLEYVDATPIRFGDIRELRVTVVNSTIQTLLLRSIELEDQLPFALELQRSFDGELRYRPALDVFDLFPGRARRTTPRVMADDTLLLPGEQTTFTGIFMRARIPEQKLTVRYQEMTTITLLRSAYFPASSRVQRSRHRYAIVPFSGLRDYRTGAHESLNRTAVIPDVNDLGPIVSSDTVFEIPIVDRETQGEIVAASGAHFSSIVTRWHEKELWIVDDPIADETFAFRGPGLSNQSGERIPLPRSDLRVFDLLDDLSARGATATVVQHDGQRIYLTTADEASSWLDRAHEAGARLEINSFEGADELPASEIVVSSAAEVESSVGEE